MISRRSIAWIFAGLVGLGSALLTSICAAQAIDPQAMALFQRGRALLAEHDYDGARAAFAESVRIDTRIGSLLNLADCEEHLGRLTEAYAHWQEAIERARVTGDDRVGYLNERLAALEPRLAMLTIHRGPRTPANAVIRRDQVEVGDAIVGREVRVDPGRHEVTVSADGFATKLYVVNLAEGAHASIEADVDAEPPSVRPPDVHAARDVPPTVTARVPSWNAGKTWALVSAGVGLAGVGVGVASGVVAMAQKDALVATPHCTSTGACDSPAAVSQWNDTRSRFRTAAGVSIASSIVGGLGLVTGAVLWLTVASPVGSPARVEVGGSGHTAELRVTW